jgi:hypothetical protein
MVASIACERVTARLILKQSFGEMVDPKVCEALFTHAYVSRGGRIATRNEVATYYKYHSHRQKTLKGARMTRVAAIRRLFLHPLPSYSLPAAAKLLGMRTKALRAWVEAGELDAVETDDGLVLPWAEVVAFGMDLWSQEAIEAALGADVTDAIPELLRLTELEVCIPRLEVVALERVAAREGRAGDAVLARELLDFVSVHGEWLEREVPGFADALAWPESVTPRISLCDGRLRV